MECVFFDAGGTLFEPRGGVGATYARFASACGVVTSGEALESAFRQAWREQRQRSGATPYGSTESDARRFWRAVVEQSFHLAGSTMPDGDYFDTVYAHFATSAAWQEFPETRAALERVRATGLRTGVLSNFDHRLRPLLADFGLMELFDVVVVSCEIGAEKPSRAIFDAARDAAGATRCALIGDSREDDYDGAQGAGWGACLVHRNGAAPPAEITWASDLIGAVDKVLRR